MVVSPDARSFPSELPRYLTSFSGRESELAALRALLANDRERLVTLIGAGGAGKTRLMIEALGPWGAHPHEAPVVFVDGASLRNATEVMPELERQLGLEQLGDETAGGQISEFLADRSVLIVLDNMEHLLAASPEVSALLHACPKVRVFATSRAPLRISIERGFPVGPLPIVASATDEPSAAAVLFAERARLARPDLRTEAIDPTLVEAICSRLDGLPLAIELAAARLRLLSPESLLALLNRQLAVLGGGAIDTAPRHQTLRAAIAWSYALLDEPEQRLFRQLGIFPQSFSLEFVEAIALDRERAGAIDRLTALYDHALIQPSGTEPDGAGRFSMLVSIREFALEQARAAHELEETSDQLTRAVTIFVNKHAAELTGPRQAESLAALSLERATIGSVLERAIARGDIDTSLSLIGGLWRFWMYQGLFLEGRTLIDRVLAGQPIGQTALWARALRGGAVIAEIQSDWVAARARGQASLQIWESLGDRAQMANSWIDLGNVHSTTGDLDAARLAYRTAVALAEEAGDARLTYIATGSLANVALRQGHLREAAEQYERILPIARETGDRWMLATLLANYGIALVRLEQRSHAQAILEESLALYREIGNEVGIASVLNSLDEALGDDLIGSKLAYDVLEIATRLDAPYLSGPANLNLGFGAMRDGKHAEAAERFSTALRDFQLADNPIFVCETIELIAELVEHTSPTVSARLLGGTSAFRARGQIEWAGYHAPRAKSLHKRLMRILGPATFDAEWSAGAELSVHELSLDALTAAAGREHLSAATSRPVAHARRLSERELTVLRAITMGRSDREIGAELFISPKTVNRHVSNILAKLDCHNRAAATALAFQFGLLENAPT